MDASDCQSFIKGKDRRDDSYNSHSRQLSKGIFMTDVSTISTIDCTHASHRSADIVLHLICSLDACDLLSKSNEKKSPRVAKMHVLQAADAANKFATIPPAFYSNQHHASRVSRTLLAKLTMLRWQSQKGIGNGMQEIEDRSHTSDV